VGGEALGFIDYEQFHQVRSSARLERHWVERAEVFVGANSDLELPMVDLVHERLGPAEHFGV